MSSSLRARGLELSLSHPEWPPALVSALLPPASPLPLPTPSDGLLREASVCEVVPHLLLADSSVGLDAARLRALRCHTLVNVVSADELPPLDDEGLATSGIEACCLLNMDAPWRDGYERRIRSAAGALAEAVLAGAEAGGSDGAAPAALTAGAAAESADAPSAAGRPRVGLVHGAGGVSRSASVVLCFLMEHARMPLAEALVRLREARPAAAPRLAYLKWLIVLDTELRGRSSVPPAMLALTEEALSGSAPIWEAEAAAGAGEEGGQGVATASGLGEAHDVEQTPN